MKKALILIIITIFSITWVLAYSPSSKFQEKLEIATKKIELIIDTKGDSYRENLLDIIEKYKIKYYKSEKTMYILNYLSDYLSNNTVSYNIVDTWVTSYYSDDSIISKPSEWKSFHWQDAHYLWSTPSYTDNNNWTVIDNVTWLMWEQDMWEKMTFEEAFIKAEKSNLAWYNDWRVSTIKELYSLIQFTGRVRWQEAITLFIDDNYFEQPTWNTSLWEREIDAQTWSSTEYVWKTMNKDDTIFGVNFVDGRIKWYPKYNPRSRSSNKMYFRLVRWNINYWKNDFLDNWNNTITDKATSLMWMKNDSNEWLNWEEALEYCEKLVLSGYSDWRLPNTKELQSIVDYTRSPQTSNSPAIDPVFYTSEINDPNGNKNYPFFWTSTVHLDWRNPEKWAAYICFGDCQWKMNWRLMDVHWAWSQRSDPKSWKQNDYPKYWWPQWDVRYVYNYVRCVR